jgi:PIN domain nuclease of toxin-antitoxin system
MRLLLDTHALLWVFEKSPRLSARATAAIFNPDATLYVSVASLWEITIKASKGKLNLPHSLVSLVRAIEAWAGTALLGIELRDLTVLQHLPHHHRDPFDRMLVAQCFSRGLQLVSNDTVLDAYGISRLW